MTFSCDPCVLLKYDNEFCIVNASQLDDFQPMLGRTRFYRTIDRALSGCSFVAMDLGHRVPLSKVRKAGAIPVVWSNETDGWEKVDA